jgi:hypothetical protein
MILFTSMLPWFPIISLLIYVPVLCYLDYKHRDIGTHKLWLPLLAINIPVLVAGYLTGLYPPVMLALTLAFSLIWFALFRHRGADCVWLICITMFAVLNPMKSEYGAIGGNFIQGFMLYLIVFTAATFWGIWLDNRFQKHINSFSMEDGIPFLIPISAAFVAAVVM